MLNDIFERVYVINLDRREDRWQAFLQRLPDDWPFKRPERFEAIDGRVVNPPSWWKGGNGAWGCYRAHVRIFEDCLNQGIRSVLILEDDAVCVEDFTNRTTAFWNALPPDWEMVYLGGQHIQLHQRLPRRHNDLVYRPYNVNRCHCYGFRGQRIIDTVYRFLHEFNIWTAPHHIDHRLGELHKVKRTGIYVPAEWLVAQSDGGSDICRRKLRYRLFRSAASLLRPNLEIPGVAVLGGYFSGSNTVAGMLHHLGIPLSRPKTKEAEPVDGQETPTPFTVYYEDAWLADICRRSFMEPWLEDLNDVTERVGQLRRWASQQASMREPEQTLFGGKHPMLSLMVPELIDAWNDPHFICVDRPDEDAIATMRSVDWKWSLKASRYALDLLRSTREEAFRKHTPKLLRLSYDNVCNDPNGTIDAVCQFLGYHPNDSQRLQALEFVTQCRNDICPETKDATEA